VRQNDDVLAVSLKDFIERGFEREGRSRRARTLAIVPTDVTAAAMARKKMVLMTG
jgi:hypothetical protein